MKKFLKGLGQIEDAVCMVAFAIMVLACIFQVLNRNIFKLPLGWIEELARFSMIWMALLGSEMGLRYGKQMSVEALVNVMPFHIRKGVLIFGDFVCALFAGITGWFSISFVRTTIQSGQISTGLGIPMWIIYLILPITMFAMCGFEIYHIVADARSKEIKEVEEEGEQS